MTEPALDPMTLSGACQPSATSPTRPGRRNGSMFRMDIVPPVCRVTLGYRSTHEAVGTVQQGPRVLDQGPLEERDSAR